jgi:hypothetical protein
MWPSVVVHEHWPVSQRMIVEMGDYAWSEHIVTVYLACQFTIKNVQVQLTVPRVVPHFDNHALADRPMFMDNNAWPHKARIVQHFLQQEAVQAIPWPAMSPDMNPIEHVLNFIDRKSNQRNPKCQNIDELRTAILPLH